LTITLALPEEAAGRLDFNITDIGTRVGFPDVPLKILFPRLRLVLIEPTTKKTAFLHHIIRKLELENVEVVDGRTEEAAQLPLHREQFALVLFRAVGLSPTLAELTLPFCQIEGRFITQKKGDIDQEINRAKEIVAVLAGKLHQIKKIELPEFNDARYLVIIDKIYPTRVNIPVVPECQGDGQFRTNENSRHLSEVTGPGGE
jgi:16S rRNA (guanine527-N7)-methyltransferase